MREFPIKSQYFFLLILAIFLAIVCYPNSIAAQEEDLSFTVPLSFYKESDSEEIKNQWENIGIVTKSIEVIDDYYHINISERDYEKAFLKISSELDMLFLKLKVKFGEDIDFLFSDLGNSGVIIADQDTYKEMVKQEFLPDMINIQIEKFILTENIDLHSNDISTIESESSAQLDFDPILTDMLFYLNLKNTFLFERNSDMVNSSINFIVRNKPLVSQFQVFSNNEYYSEGRRSPSISILSQFSVLNFFDIIYPFANNIILELDEKYDSTFFNDYIQSKDITNYIEYKINDDTLFLALVPDDYSILMDHLEEEHNSYLDTINTQNEKIEKIEYGLSFNNLALYFDNESSAKEFDISENFLDFLDNYVLYSTLDQSVPTKTGLWIRSFVTNDESFTIQGEEIFNFTEPKEYVFPTRLFNDEFIDYLSQLTEKTGVINLNIEEDLLYLTLLKGYSNTMKSDLLKSVRQGLTKVEDRGNLSDVSVSASKYISGGGSTEESLTNEDYSDLIAIGANLMIYQILSDVHPNQIEFIIDIQNQNSEDYSYFSRVNYFDLESIVDSY